MGRGSQRGQVFPLVAFSALVLLGAAGFAVDVGYHQYRQRVQQTAADAAAIAGAQDLLVGNYQKSAANVATLNGFTDNTGGTTCPTTSSVGTVCVDAYNPPQSSDVYNGNTSAVEVDITTFNPTFFEKVVGITNVPVTTKAVAILVNRTSDGCVYVLNGQANFNNGNVTAPNCGLIFNQATNFHGATVDAASLYCAAGCSGGTFTGATPQPASPASDPCPSITYCAHLAQSPPPCTSPQNVKATAGKPYPMTPGCYSGADLSKASSVTFGCGLYVINGTLNVRASGKNAVPIPISQDCGTGGSNGVTFFVTGGGSIDMGNDVINLSAPTSGDYTEWSSGEQNTLIYQDPSDINTLNMQSATATCGVSTGCNSFLSGMIYAPTAPLNYNQYNSTNTGAVLIIAGTLNANGSATAAFTAPGGTGPYTIKVAELGE